MLVRFIDVDVHQNLKLPCFEFFRTSQRLILSKRSHAGLLHQLLCFLASSPNKPFCEGVQTVELREQRFLKRGKRPPVWLVRRAFRPRLALNDSKSPRHVSSSTS